MVTFEQISKLGYGDELHYAGRHDCKVNVGPRGGVSEDIVKVRKSGRLITWKRKPGQFRQPVKHGLRSHGSIYDWNANDFHLASECPALAQYAEFVAEQLREAQARCQEYAHFDHAGTCAQDATLNTFTGRTECSKWARERERMVGLVREAQNRCIAGDCHNGRPCQGNCDHRDCERAS